ncbi:MAG: AGE family epimerase/isomerase [Melioribacteraceae bacterium]|nr:AGE family epimerase/isomerase [Melioribacteraceae bacterium]MCF8431566.1 AGE family epimerase/isomerase [Melioribacteraceae bacterium]
MNISKYFVFAVFLLLSVSSVTGQYNYQSSYLENPDLMKGFVDSCATFWFNSYDRTYGGFYENVSREGNATGSSKTMLSQSRNAYGMVRAFMLTGDTTFLSYARGALDFMYANAWDDVHGGWFNEFNRDGSLNSGGANSSYRNSFFQHYALLGISAMVDATRNSKDWAKLLEGRKIIDEKLWDSRPDYHGYYDEADLDWSNPRGKGFTPTMDGVTTHVLSMYLLTGESKYKERLIILADNIIDHIWPAMDLFNYSFPESYNDNWEPDLSDTFVFTGHSLKTAWCAERAYLIDPKPEYMEFSTYIIEEVLDKGYDHQNGGNYSTADGLSGNLHNTNKVWWELQQGFNSSVMNYYISKDEKFLKMADEILDFFMTYFADPVYGEVYNTSNRFGSVNNKDKAGYWKAGYHSIELGFHTYMYGNLYLHKKPVELFYKYEPADSARSIFLYPIAIEDDKLIIKNVELDGELYTDFSSADRILNVPAGTHGIFKVIYTTTDATAIANDNIPADFKLEQNYPNPFNPNTYIKFTLSQSSNVSIKIFDVLGREVATLVNEFKDAGNYTVNFDASTLTSGLYVYRLEAANFLASKKMILLR